MNAEIQVRNDAVAIEKALIEGDLSGLTPEQRLSYYKQVCESVGLNPLTKPFAYLKLNGKIVLYALRDCTDQLRKVNKVSITRVSTQKIEDVFVVTAEAQDATGRTDSSTGAVAIGNQKGDNLANLLMKAETKAKRRVTLSICGLGMMDETEVETVKGATPFTDEERNDYISGKIAELSATKQDISETISGVLAQEIEKENSFWYLIVTPDKQQIPFVSPKATDEGRLADRLGATVVLKGIPFEKENKRAYELTEIVSIVPKTPQDASEVSDHAQQPTDAPKGDSVPANGIPEKLSGAGQRPDSIIGEPMKLFDLERLMTKGQKAYMVCTFEYMRDGKKKTLKATNWHHSLFEVLESGLDKSFVLAVHEEGKPPKFVIDDVLEVDGLQFAHGKPIQASIQPVAEAEW